MPLREWPDDPVEAQLDAAEAEGAKIRSPVMEERDRLQKQKQVATEQARSAEERARTARCEAREWEQLARAAEAGLKALREPSPGRDETDG